MINKYCDFVKAGEDKKRRVYAFENRPLIGGDDHI
jgi:hypothetical protein